MIQRIQSLYLTLVILTQILISQFNFINFSAAGIDYHLNTNGIIDTTGKYSQEESKQLLLVGLAIFFAVISIVLFKNRPLQIKFTKFISFVCLMQVAFVCVSTYHFAENDTTNIQLGVSSYLALISGILAILAGKAIKKDDNLVKSVDRIR